jgi:hypothetical protein
MTKKSAQDPDREKSPTPRKRRRPRLTNSQLIEIFRTIVVPLIIIALTR